MKSLTTPGPLELLFNTLFDATCPHHRPKGQLKKLCMFVCVNTQQVGFYLGVHIRIDVSDKKRISRPLGELGINLDKDCARTLLMRPG